MSFPLTISARTFVKIVLLVVATFLLLSLLQRTVYALTLIVISIFLAFALNAPVSWVAEHLPGKLRRRRGPATAAAFLLVIGLITAFLLSVLPPVIRQVELIITHAPDTLQHLRTQYSNVNELVVRYHLQGQVQGFINNISDRLRSSTTGAVGALTGVVNSVVSVITVLVLTFMMLVEGPVWLAFGESLAPARSRAHVNRLRQAMYGAIKGYVNGQITLAILASLLVLPGLLIFHVSYPFALMAVVFICGLIPMVGHTFGALIVAFVALFYSPVSAIGILIYYILYQQLENNLIAPRLQAHTTNMSPLMIFISLMIGVSFAGLVGGLIAIPVGACLRVWAVDYLESRHSGTGDAELKPTATN